MWCDKFCGGVISVGSIVMGECCVCVCLCDTFACVIGSVKISIIWGILFLFWVQEGLRAGLWWVCLEFWHASFRVSFP